MQKRGIYEQIVRVLENNGGLILSHIAIFVFYSYLFLAHWKPNSGLVKLLQAHGSTAQVISIAAVLTAALLTWWGEKVLFRLKEREDFRRLEHRVAELESSDTEKKVLIAELKAGDAEKDAHIAEKDARIAEKDARIAEKDARIAELVTRIAALENQNTPAQPEQH